MTKWVCRVDNNERETSLKWIHSQQLPKDQKP